MRASDAERGDEHDRTDQQHGQDGQCEVQPDGPEGDQGTARRAWCVISTGADEPNIGADTAARAQHHTRPATKKADATGTVHGRRVLQSARKPRIRASQTTAYSAMTACAVNSSAAASSQPLHEQHRARSGRP